MPTTPPFVRFDRSREFHSELRKRISSYFKDHNISKTGNTELYIKAIFMVLLYFVPWAFLISGMLAGSFWGQFAMAILMGLGMTGIGLCIMHDANHGSFSKRKWVNKMFSHIIIFIGGNSFNWRVQHNLLHHSFTNIDGMDEDISTIPVLRFSPLTKKLGIHKLQFIYAWFFYGLMTIWWITGKDYIQLVNYKKNSLIKTQNTTFTRELLFLIGTKMVYFFLFLVLPVWLGGIGFWQWLGLFCIMHFVAGLTMALIFQSAHVLSETEFPTPDENKTMEDNFALHQLKTTANFGTNNRTLGWLTGGLNFQVEHHLFPHISHVHYRQISKIVEQTAREFNYPYLKHSTFGRAISSHARMLYKLGRVKEVQPIPVRSS